MKMGTYNELKEKALAFNAAQEDINALGEWFERYGRSDWNGECWTVDAYHNLYPIHKEVGYDEYEVVGYTFSSWDEDRFIPLPFPTPEARAAWEAEEEEKCWKEQQEYEAEKKKREEFFMKMPLEELVERYSIGFRLGRAHDEIVTGKMYQAMEDGAEHAIWRRRKSIKKFLREKWEAEWQRREQLMEEKQKAKEAQENAVPGLEELREAVDEYNEAFDACYFGDRPMCTLDAEEKKLYALAEENRRAAAYLYAKEYGRRFAHNAGENAMAAIAKGEDISETLARMREEGGTGRHITCLMFGELFEMRP